MWKDVENFVALKRFANSYFDKGRIMTIFADMMHLFIFDYICL